VSRGQNGRGDFGPPLIVKKFYKKRKNDKLFYMFLGEMMGISDGYDSDYQIRNHHVIFMA